MLSYLHANLDCVLFTQSVALLVVAIQARYLEKRDRNLAWRWFLFFSVLQALYAWCGLSVLARLVPALHPAGEKFLWILSLACLAEFARRTNPVAGRWKHGLLLHIPVAAALSCLDISPVGLALLSGIPAAVFTSWSLWGAAKRQDFAEAAIRLKSTALFLPSYLITGAVAAQAPFLEIRTPSEPWTPADEASLVGALASAAFAVLLFCFLHGYHKARKPSEQLADPDETGLRSRHLWSGLCVLVIIGGWLGTNFAAHRHERALKDEVLTRARLVAASLSPSAVASLKGDASDAGNPAYHELRNQLRALAEASGDFRYITLLAIGDDGYVSLVDTEEDAPRFDEGPVGEALASPYPRLPAGADERGAVFGPVSDAHGTWISTMLSLPVLLSDGRRTVLELDVSASSWEEQLFRARLPVLAMTLLIAGFLIGSLLTQESVRRHAARTAISEHRNSSIIAASPDCILMFDPDGSCMSVNQAGLRSLHLPKEKILGRNFSSFWPEHAQTMVLESLRRARLGKPTLFEADYVRPDCKINTFRVAINPVQDTKGRVRAIVGICVDITARKYMERDLVAAKEAAEAATRAKSEFLAVMSHEIRTPLSGVIGMLGLLQKQPLQTRERRYAELARECAENLLEILNDILDTAKIESGKFSIESIPFRPRKVFGRVVDIMRTRADAKELDLFFSIAPSVPEVLVGDPTRLRQVLSNLVSNALKFTVNGAVKVAIESEHNGPSSIRLKVSVSDSGIGISEEALKVIFNKFEQADSTTTREFGGTGLGLAIVKGIADLMGGTVDVDSAIGRGTTFAFSAPLPVGSKDDVEETDDRLGHPGGERTPTAPLSLLCAEDNATNRVIVQYIVRHMGHEVDFVENGREAVERLRTMRYDAVLMDSRMPVMDGLQATRLIRDPASGALEPKIPIISLTANTSASHIEQCRASGMDEFLEKPVREDALGAVLDRIGARKSPLGRAHEEERESREAEPVGGLSAEELLAMMKEQEKGEASDGGAEASRQASRAILTQYLVDAPARIEEMKGALGAGDRETLARAAHSLKSISRYVAASELSELGARIETLADEGRTTEIPELLEKAEASLSPVKKRIEETLSH